MSHPPPARILVVVLDNIGDLVFSSVIFRQLRARWPACELTVWCKDYAFEIAQLLPGSPRIYSADPIWDKSPGRKKGRWTPFLRTLWELRGHHFDLAIVCTKNWRASAATALLHTKRRIGYAAPKSNRFLCDSITTSASQESVIQELNHLLTPLFEPDPQVRYQLDRDALAIQRNRLLSEGSVSLPKEPYIILHAFAGNVKRCMALEEWIKLASGIRQRGLMPVWIGSPTELQKLKSISPELNRISIFSDACGKGRVIDDAILISEAQFYIGHDSGPIHIASALGIPTLGLYLPSTPWRTSPQGVGAVTVINRSSPAEINFEDVLIEFDRMAGQL